MKTHDELVAVLQVGTRRAALPPQEVVPDLANSSPENQALVLSGVLDLMVRAGALPMDGVPKLAPSPAEERSVAWKSTEALTDALAAGMAGSVLEWAAKAQLAGKVAPPAVLVKLLPMIRKHKELLPILGNRGQWLAAIQGQDLESPLEDDFLSNRVADPRAYREWLSTELDNMDWKERAKAVSGLREGLTLEDEPLLERALVDRRKEVREPACDLLASTSGSRVAKELSALALPLLALEKSFLRKVLAVNPPEPADLPKWLPKTPSRTDFGPKALALFDVIRYLPPKKWSIDASPEQLLDLATNTDYTEAIYSGLQEAAIRFADQEWIDVCFEFFFSNDAIKQEAWPGLTHLASESTFDRVVSAKFVGFRADPTTAAWTLTLRKKPLSLEISQTVLTSLRTNVNHHYTLLHLAEYLHPASLPLVEAPYSDQEHFENTRLHLHKVLNIRHRLLASLVD